MNKTLKKGLYLLSILAISAFFAFNNPSERYFEIAKNLDIFATLFKEVNTYYVDEISPNDMIKSGIDAMLGSLDPYTNYIPEDDIEDFRTLTTGQYGGIGALIGNRDGKSLVIMPYKGFPAHKQGMIIGDEVLEVNGISVKGKSTAEISKLLKGQANTDVTLTLKRYGQSELITMDLTREKITINNVPYYGMVNDEVGYIKLSDFTTKASKEVRNALEELKDNGAKKVILDLRDNPGGLLNEAVNISNIFIPKGSEVVSTRGKVKDWNKTYKALNEPIDNNMPVVVLTSSRSASASEIVAGVIQDYDRGVLVGQKSFGKGLVQATRPLTYNSQLKVTTAKYYTPSGRCIQAIDYSNRNDDGSVGKIPDSLKVSYKTKNGRTVYDGGGIDPDLEVSREYFAAITSSLIEKSLVFQYANKFHFENKEIASAKEFRVSEEVYSDFVTWLGGMDFSYNTRLEKSIEDLQDIAKKEKYYDEVKDQISDLKATLALNKKADLKRFKEEIKYALEREIVSRYYLQQGVIESSFDYDPDVQQALEVLKDSDRYNKILARN